MDDSNVGLGVRVSIGADGKRETKLFGQGIKNLKEELKKDIINEIQEQIVKPENERIRSELEELKQALNEKDEGLLKRTLSKIIEKGAEEGVNIIVKLILASLGTN